HFRLGQPLMHLAIARERVGEAEMDGIKNRVENGAEASLLRLLGGAKERSQVAVADRDQHWPRAGLFGDRNIALGEAEQVVGAGRAASTQLLGLGRIDADRQSPR